MIRYGELVDYIKKNHVSWNTDLFEVLRGFFEEYYPPQLSSPTSLSHTPSQQELIFEHSEFKAPKDGEYTPDDLIDLFST